MNRLSLRSNQVSNKQPGTKALPTRISNMAGVGTGTSAASSNAAEAGAIAKVYCLKLKISLLTHYIIILLV
jgi:hypothetical protein